MVVDNGSRVDETIAIKKDFNKKLPLLTLRVEKNLGFVGGNNLAFQQLPPHTTHVLLLNNDTEVEPDFLNLLLNALDTTPHAGIAGPAIWNFDRKTVQSAGMSISLWTGNTLFRPLKATNDAYLVPGVSGCAFLMKKEVLEKVGLLDEDYFAYFEETDFCVRAKKIGYNVLLVPASRIYHKGGQTAGTISGFHERMIARNRLIFLKKNASKFQYGIALLCIFSFYVWFRSLKLILSAHPEGLKPFWKGIKQGLTFRPS